MSDGYSFYCSGCKFVHPGECEKFERKVEPIKITAYDSVLIKLSKNIPAPASRFITDPNDPFWAKMARSGATINHKAINPKVFKIGSEWIMQTMGKNGSWIDITGFVFTVVGVDPNQSIIWLDMLDLIISSTSRTEYEMELWTDLGHTNSFNCSRMVPKP